MATPEPIAPAPTAPTAPAPAPAPATAAVAGEEDCSADFVPVVQLTQIETKTGEEDESEVFKMRAKLFRFSSELKEWKERGTGNVRLMQHKDTSKIRLLMRREKTLKICLNHFVDPTVELRENVGSDRSWVWSALDYADEATGTNDLLAIRFKNSENAELFKSEYEKAQGTNKDILGKQNGKTDVVEEKVEEKKEEAAEEKKEDAAAEEKKDDAEAKAE